MNSSIVADLISLCSYLVLSVVFIMHILFRAREYMHNVQYWLAKLIIIAQCTCRL